MALVRYARLGVELNPPGLRLTNFLGGWVSGWVQCWVGIPPLFFHGKPGFMGLGFPSAPALSTYMYPDFSTEQASALDNVHSCRGKAGAGREEPLCPPHGTFPDPSVQVAFFTSTSCWLHSMATICPQSLSKGLYKHEQRTFQDQGLGLS